MKQEIQELIGISDRIAVLNINIPGYQKMWSIIQVYAPTEQAAENETKAFYDELTLTVTKFSHNHIILMGDFNAQIGEKQSKDEHVLGNFGQGRRSPNGELLVEFLLENNLKILNSLFKKNKKNKWTWISPDGSYKNEIDFVATSYPKAFTDTSVITKFNFNTNHRMVRSSLSTESPRKSRKHIGMLNAEQHSSKTLEKIADSLCKIRKEITENRNTDVLVKYGKLEKLITQHAKVDFSRENKYKLTDTTLKLIEERKNLLSKHPKKENIKLVTELSKKIKENIRKDRKNKRQQTLENHIKRTGGVKKALKELREIDKEWIPKLKNDGITSSNRNSVNKMATIFYKDLYSSSGEKQEQTNTLTKNQDPIEPEPKILPNEVEKAILSQKMATAPGPDKITNELLKGTLEELIPILTAIFNDIMETDIIPKQWTTSHIILIYKKGQKEDINNYRPISLMSNIYKVFSKVILERISKRLDENQPREQAGFRQKFSTLDHIHTVKQIIEKYREYNKNIYMAFIDYSKAFDSISHKAIWKNLEQQGIPTKYINIIKNIYLNCEAKIQLETLGEKFSIKRGARQGDPLSPKLFSAVLEGIFRKLDWNGFGLNILGTKLNHLRFADDIVLFEENPAHLEEMINSLNEESVKDQTTKEINRRVANGWKKFWALKEIVKSKEISMSTKRKVFDTCILPVITYGCETWSLTKLHRQKLQRCQRAMERSMTGNRIQDRVRSSVIRERTNVVDILTRIDQQKWRWTGHMIRDPHNKWSTIVSDWFPRDGKRNRGRQHMRWEDDLKFTAGHHWRRVARDRTQWKMLEEAYANRHTELRDIL
nr:LINE-1 retrotransposable element ORF2 protein [Helicoverpa armigera]